MEKSVERSCETTVDRGGDSEDKMYLIWEGVITSNIPVIQVSAAVFKCSYMLSAKISSELTKKTPK